MATIKEKMQVAEDKYAEQEVKADTLFQRFVDMPYSLAVFAAVVVGLVVFGLWLGSKISGAG